MTSEPVRKLSVEVNINGTPHKSEVESRTTLWELLSEKLHLTGTVRSCNRGTCGVCTVLVDGRPFYSCHLLAGDVNGKSLTTIESLQSDRIVSTLQKAAYSCHAAQCGYCTAGWMVAAKTLLEKRLDVTEQDVKETLAGHLCRCGAYKSITRAILEAAEELRSGKGDAAPSTDHSVIVPMPMVRDYSTGGGHGKSQTLIEGDERIVTVKWQGHPPAGLGIIGKPIPPLPEVSKPKISGSAEYATRVVRDGMLYAAVLGSPHPHARIRRIDASKAGSIQGVHLVLTCENAPEKNPLGRELNFQGDIVAVSFAESEDIAEDALDAIEVDYEKLPHVGSLDDALKPDAYPLRLDGNMLHIDEEDPAYCADATARWSHGSVEKGFADSDIIREFTYRYGGSTVLPMQPLSGVAEWDGGTLTFHGMAQGINASRRQLSQWLGIDGKNIRFVDKWNGGTFGARMTLRPLDGLIAHAAIVTGRPVKYSLPISSEISQVALKPEVLQKFSVGAKKDGTIVALKCDAYQTVGFTDKTPTAGTPLNESARDQFLLYGVHIPNWQLTSYCYKTNTPQVGAARSNTQQEFKLGFECMMDELAEEFGRDPLEYRLRFVSRPGDVLSPASDWGSEFGKKIELENGGLKFDSYASVEVIREGEKTFEWEHKAYADIGKGGVCRGVGVAVVDHHGGQLGWREGEVGFERSKGDVFNAEIVLDSAGTITLKNVQPESGTDHDTSIAQTISELLGYKSIGKIRLLWGDSEIGVDSAAWFGGRTNTLQGGAVLVAAEKLLGDLRTRAAAFLGAGAGELEIEDGVVHVKGSRERSVSFAELARHAGGTIRQWGVTKTGPGKGRALVRSVGACFAEVEVNIMTGVWRVKRIVFVQDAGKVINPLLSEGDMDGAFIQGLNTTADGIPWDRTAPGHLLAGMAFLSYRMPTIKEVPDEIRHVFIESLEPRWYFGYKSFGETAIGAVPSAIVNAIYNATGVRIREHPITPERVLEEMRRKVLSG